MVWRFFTIILLRPQPHRQAQNIVDNEILLRPLSLSLSYSANITVFIGEDWTQTRKEKDLVLLVYGQDYSTQNELQLIRSIDFIIDALD